MLSNKRIVVVLLVALFGLSACVVPPPRQRVIYHESADQGRSPSDRGYASSDREDSFSDQEYSGRYCHRCGTVRDIDQVELRQQTSGGGAVLGAIIGGVIGNQFGRGGGRAAATAIGAVGGAAIGNEVEENDSRARSGYAWRFRVELDDGRWATVTQYENPGFRPGARVFVSRDHLQALRNRSERNTDRD
jgi:outer membrane lipoprotein SlyB